MVDFLHHTGRVPQFPDDLTTGKATRDTPRHDAPPPIPAEAAWHERMCFAALGAEVGRACTQAGTLPNMLQRCAGALVHHLHVALVRIWTLHSQEHMLEPQASVGMDTHRNGEPSRIPVAHGHMHRIAQECQPHLTNAVLSDPCVTDQEWARRAGMMAFAGYPFTIDSRLVRVLELFARQPLPDTTLEILATIAPTMALGVASGPEHGDRRHAGQRHGS